MRPTNHHDRLNEQAIAAMAFNEILGHYGASSELRDTSVRNQLYFLRFPMNSDVERNTDVVHGLLQFLALKLHVNAASPFFDIRGRRW